jgi:tetratricopeptide (TPR) repeat protein
MAESREPEISLLRRWLAYAWFFWGQSWCYWGIRTAERVLFRFGISSFDNAIRVWPEFTAAIYRRGLIRGRELGQYKEAIADLSHALELSPEWPEPYLQRGLFQRFHGDPQAAIADLQHYLALGGELYWRLEAQRQIEQLHAEIAERADSDHASM